LDIYRKRILKLILEKQFAMSGTELNRIECRGFVNAALNLRFSLKAGNELLDGANVHFFKENFYHKQRFYGWLYVV
jgi:hypothetical protein